MSDGLPGVGHDDKIVPGTRATFHGIDVIAFGGVDIGCTSCPFTKQLGHNGNGHCGSVPCLGVTWLTVPDYITHRLTK